MSLAPLLEAPGTIPLHAGQQYPITMEFYENGGGAVAQLSWSSPSTAKAIIPQSQLYPKYASSFLPLPGVFTNGAFRLQLSGLVGKGYVLQATADFTNWVSLATNSPAADPNVALPTNRFNFTDPGATNFLQRYYRGLQQP